MSLLIGGCVKSSLWWYICMKIEDEKVCLGKSPKKILFVACNKKYLNFISVQEHGSTFISVEVGKVVKHEP